MYALFRDRKIKIIEKWGVVACLELLNQHFSGNMEKIRGKP
jgi:hypothetical protein